MAVDIILVSLKREIDLFIDLLTQVTKRKESGVVLYEGALQGKRVRVIRTGIGNRELDASLFSDCDRIISSGFCGALVSELKAGDMVFAHEILYADPDYLSNIFSKKNESKPHAENHAHRAVGDEEAFSSLSDALIPEGITVLRGRSVTAARIIKTSTEKAALHTSTGAISVDMEDYHRLNRAKRLNIPFISIRSVLDSRRDEIPGFRRGFHLGSDLSSLLRNVSSAQTAIALSIEKLLL
jgi:adenosylhomocysteine nucleosidase